ncbi:hypothetical protein VTK26DRAFT_569 [Humicola hyalothermophila]
MTLQCGCAVCWTCLRRAGVLLASASQTGLSMQPFRVCPRGKVVVGVVQDIVGQRQRLQPPQMQVGGHAMCCPFGFLSHEPSTNSGQFVPGNRRGNGLRPGPESDPNPPRQGRGRCRCQLMIRKPTSAANKQQVLCPRRPSAVGFVQIGKSR